MFRNCSVIIFFNLEKFGIVKIQQINTFCLIYYLCSVPDKKIFKYTSSYHYFEMKKDVRINKKTQSIWIIFAIISQFHTLVWRQRRKKITQNKVETENDEPETSKKKCMPRSIEFINKMIFSFFYSKRYFDVLRLIGLRAGFARLNLLTEQPSV